MDEMIEVLFCCDLNDNQLSCTASDFRTGTNLMSYKGGGSIQPQSMNILRAEYVIAASDTKPMVHVWPMNSQEPLGSVRFVVPGRITAMALSPDGVYLVAGIQETLYIWHLTTGRMLNTVSKHFQPVTCVRFTDDASHFVSAGQDGNVLVWNLTQVVGRGDDNQSELYCFSDHGLPVTDVHVGCGGLRANLFTVSLDRTCKVYDLSNGILLLNVVFAEALKCVMTDALETCVYVGTTEGKICEFHVDSLPRTKEYHMEKEHTNAFVGHKEGTAVNCLAISLDGQTLVSGGKDHQECVWHIQSRQLLKSVLHKGEITNIRLRLTNPAIFHPEHKQPQVFTSNLRRMIDPPSADEEQVIEILITDQDQNDHEVKNANSRGRPFSHRHIPKGVETNGVSDVSSKEIERLQAEVARLTKINKNLFDAASKHVLRNKK